MKDGGPAFPCKELRDNFDDSAGMSLRDYFAAAALTLAERDESASPTSMTYQAIAERAYLYADAMLAAREKT